MERAHQRPREEGGKKEEWRVEWGWGEGKERDTQRGFAKYL